MKYGLFSVPPQGRKRRADGPSKAYIYQYLVGLMTFANPVSGPLGVFIIDEMLEQRMAELFEKEDLSPAIVDGRHRRSCLEKLAESGEPGTECASQPTCMTLIKAPGSEVVTVHNLLKLSWSANVL